MTQTEQSAGGLVVRNREVLLIRDRYGRWTFPKGHLEEGETERQAALREVREETGIHCRVGPRLGTVHYYLPSGRQKRVTFYLMTYLDGEISALEAEISDARWWELPRAQDLLRTKGYPGYRVLLRRAIEIVTR